MNPEVKSIIDEIVMGVLKVLNLQNFASRIASYINEKYKEGMDESEEMFDMNFLPRESDLSFLQGYVNQNVEDVADDIGKNLRQEISRGLLAGDDTEGIKQRVREVFRDKKYTDRLKTVLRTEGIRAKNKGSLEGARQSNFKLKKYVIIVDDTRTSHICHKEDAKYGTPEQAIPLNEQFEVIVDNKTIRADAPPFHVNCRSTLGYVRADDDS